MGIAVIGAGISGLATATFLAEKGHDVIVLEAADRPGGNVQTLREGGRTLDLSANGWLNSEPAMDRLLEIAGLSDRTVPAGDKYSSRWIYAGGRMHPVPMSPLAMIKTELFGAMAKLRLLGEPFIGRGPEGETVGEFVRRRLGPAFVDKMVGPMVAGIYAADPDQLELKAAFPRMAELEAEYRSLFIAMMKLRGGGAPKGHLTTLQGGVGTLTETLAARLDVRCGQSVTAVERRKESWAVHTAGGRFDANAVVLACPGHAQARIVRGLDPDVAEALDGIPYAPVAVVVSAWPAGAFDRPPDGFGVLVARGEDVPVLGTLFTHCIFPGQANEGEILLRSILGGSVAPETTVGDDQELFGRSRRAQQAFFGSERAEPLAVHVFRHERGIPQYRRGHTARVGALRKAEKRFAGLWFVGNHVQGIGVKDCAKEGERVAGAIGEWLAR